MEKAVKEKAEATPKPETTARVASGYTASEQASADAAKAAAADAEVTHDAQASAETGSVVAGTSGEEREEQAEGSCRLVNYVADEGMSQQEGAAFSEQVANEMMADIEADPSMTGGPAQNAALDRLDVPRYPECKQ